MNKTTVPVLSDGFHLNRRSFIKTGLIGGLATAAMASASGMDSIVLHPSAEKQTDRFNLNEMTIADLQITMSDGRFTSQSITEQYLARIRSIDQEGYELRSVIELNPDAISIAQEMDRERIQGKVRGPLHGIPVLIKDNIDTSDQMHTTAGSLALLNTKPFRDAFLVRNLRKAGAVLLGKTNLSEWANFRSSRSSSGWSARGGQTKNPFSLNRNPSGSSSGSAVAVSANLCCVAVGTETDGSIISPSSTCGIVGIKPTVGLISRSGIIPISHSQDTAGPMTRTVKDAAILLGILAGADPDDSTTKASTGTPLDYSQFLDSRGMRGKRIGIVRQYFGFHESVDQLMENAIELMKREGAEIIDPAPIPSLGKFDESEMIVLLYEFKADLNVYLSHLPDSAEVRSLKDLIDFNMNNRSAEMPFFGQDLLIKAEATSSLKDVRYLNALKNNAKLARKEGIDSVMNRMKLDALMAPSGGPAWMTDLVNGDHFTGGSSNSAAVAGYPNITIPAGHILGLPVGLSFFGRAWSEPELIRIAYHFEQTISARKPPEFSTSGV